MRSRIGSPNPRKYFATRSVSSGAAGSRNGDALITLATPEVISSLSDVSAGSGADERTVDDRGRARPPHGHVGEGDPPVRRAGLDLQRRPQRGQLPPLRRVGDLVRAGDRQPPLARTHDQGDPAARGRLSVYLDRPDEPIGPRLAEL